MGFQPLHCRSILTNYLSSLSIASVVSAREKLLFSLFGFYVPVVVLSSSNRGLFNLRRRIVYTEGNFTKMVASYVAHFLSLFYFYFYVTSAQLGFQIINLISIYTCIIIIF